MVSNQYFDISKSNNQCSDVYSSAESFRCISEMWIQSISFKVKRSTLDLYSNVLNKHIIPSLGDVAISNFDTTILELFTKSLLQSGRRDGNGGLSANTVREMITIVKLIIDYSTTVKQIPTALIKYPYPREAPLEMRVLSRPEQALLENELDSNTDRYKIGIFLSLYTGLRIGELCALQAKHIDAEGGVIKVRQTVQRVKNKLHESGKKTETILGTPKSASSIRDIPIPSFALFKLISFLSANENHFIITGKEKPAEPRTLQTRFCKTLDAAEIAPANFHSLRHTFATRCVEFGVDVKSLSEILGHSNVNITLNKYVHSSMENKKRNIEKLQPITTAANFS